MWKNKIKRKNEWKWGNSSFYFLLKAYASIHCKVCFTFYSLTSYHIFYCIWFSTLTVYFNFMCIYLNILGANPTWFLGKAEKWPFSTQWIRCSLLYFCSNFIWVHISVRQFSFTYYNFFGTPIGTNLWQKS
jgi:hypothetical protein